MACATGALQVVQSVTCKCPALRPDKASASHNVNILGQRWKLTIKQSKQRDAVPHLDASVQLVGPCASFKLDSCVVALVGETEMNTHSDGVVASKGLSDSLRFAKEGSAVTIRHFCKIADSIIHASDNGIFKIRLTVSAELSMRDQRTSQVLEYVGSICESKGDKSALSTSGASHDFNAHPPLSSRSGRSSFVSTLFSAGRRSSRTSGNAQLGRDMHQSNNQLRRHGSNVSMRSRSPSTPTARIDEVYVAKSSQVRATIERKKDGGKKHPTRQHRIRQTLEPARSPKTHETEPATPVMKNKKTRETHVHKEHQDIKHDPKVVESLTRELATLKKERNSLHKSLHDLQLDPNSAANISGQFPTQAEVVCKYEAFLLQASSLLFDLYDTLGESSHALVGATVKRCAMQANKVVNVWHQSQLTKARALAELDESMLDHAHKLFGNVLQMTLTWDKALPEKVSVLLTQVLEGLPETLRRSAEFFPHVIFRLGRYRLASSTSDMSARWDTIGMETRFNSDLHSPLGPAIKHKEHVMVLLPALTVSRGAGQTELLCKAVVTDMA